MNILAYQAKSNPYQANSNLKHKNMRHPKNKNSSSVRLIGASGKIIKSKNTILYKAV